MLTDAVALDPPELVSNQPQDLAGRFRSRVRLGFDVAAPLQRIEARLRAVGQTAFGPKHLVQPVAALAPGDADGEIDRHVVRMRSRDSEMADPDLRLHRVRLVDHDHPPRRVRRLNERFGRQIFLVPIAEHFFRGRERFLGGHVADDRQDGVVRREVAAVKGEQVVARQRSERLRRAVGRHAVRMESVHQPIEDRVGDVLGILEADLETRQHLLPLSFDFSGGERRLARQLGQHAHAFLETVLHHDHVAEREVGRGAGAHGAADEIDLVVHLFGGLRLRSLIEQRGDKVREPELALWIGRRPGANQEPHRHGGLLVMQDRDDLQAVRHRLQLVRRKFDVTRRQRPRRLLGGPLPLPCLSACGAPD